MSEETFVSDGYELIEFTSYSWDKQEQCLGIVGYTGSESEIVIPREINGLPVFHIENFAFSGKGLVSVVIPEGVQYIGERAFADCSSMKHLVAPSTVKEIAPDAFLGTPFVSRKILSGLSEHEELDRYWEWADWHQSGMLSRETNAIFGRKRWKVDYKNHNIKWQKRHEIEVALRKEKEFDENSAIDGFGFSFGGEQYVAITSFTDRPGWHWHVASCSPHQAWEHGTDWESREGTWDPQRAESFFEELRSLRFFDWDFRYDHTGICDGYSWGIFVKFSHNGTYFHSSGYEAYPRNFKKFNELLRRFGFREMRY